MPSWLNQALAGLALLLLAGCAGQGGVSPYSPSPAAPTYAPTHYYPPPGPPEDPWGPYINEAAARFAIPAQWIRAVMAQESGGEEQAVSPVGAIGLMQVMPATYQALEAQNNLGDDPFNPQDNILAGAAYIKQMYDRYGAPGFLAAYNAGPEALDSYLAGDGPLPEETQNYLASVTPNLGNDVPMSGPLANVALASAGSAAPDVASFATGCDVNAAFDPDHPCTAQMADNIVATEQTPMSPAAGRCDLNAAYDPDSPCTPGTGSAGACDLDTAYDPGAPCQAPAQTVAAQTPGETVPAQAPAETLAAQAPGDTEPAPVAEPDASAIFEPGTSPSPPVAQAALPAAPMPAAPSPASWAIQVGAFASAGLARTVALGAQAEDPSELGAASIALPTTQPLGGLVLYRARLTNLSAVQAASACARLNARQLPCIVVPAAAA